MVKCGGEPWSVEAAACRSRCNEYNEAILCRYALLGNHGFQKHKSFELKFPIRNLIAVEKPEAAYRSVMRLRKERGGATRQEAGFQKGKP
jgi:hypothetical protein